MCVVPGRLAESDTMARPTKVPGAFPEKRCQSCRSSLLQNEGNIEEDNLISKEEFLRMIANDRHGLYSGLCEYRQINKEYIDTLKEDLIGI